MEKRQGGGGKALEEEIGHEPNANQIQDEPVPASHHDDRRPEAVVRNEELSVSGDGDGDGDGESADADEDADRQGSR